MSQVEFTSETTADSASLVVASVRSNNVGSEVPQELLEATKNNATVETAAYDS